MCCMPSAIRPERVTTGLSSRLSLPLPLVRFLSEAFGYQFDQRLAYERGLARAGHAGDRRHHAEGEPRIEPIEIVASYAAESQPALRLTAASHVGVRREQMPPRLRMLDVAQSFRRSGVEHRAALFSRAGAYVHDPVGAAHDLDFMLHDEDRVARGLRPSSASSKA